MDPNSRVLASGGADELYCCHTDGGVAPGGMLLDTTSDNGREPFVYVQYHLVA